MLQISVKSDMDDLARTLDRAQRRQMPKIIKGTLDRTATQTQTTAIKTISKETGIKQKTVRATFRVFKAKTTALVAVIRTRVKRAPNIIQFKAKQTKVGVIASPWRKRRTFKGAFIANQGRTVFIRKNLGDTRSKIKALWGPAIPNELIRKHVVRAWRKTIKARLPINFAQSVNRYFPKKVK